MQIFAAVNHSSHNTVTEPRVYSVENLITYYSFFRFASPYLVFGSPPDSEFGSVSLYSSSCFMSILQEGLLLNPLLWLDCASL